MYYYNFAQCGTFIGFSFSTQIYTQFSVTCSLIILVRTKSWTGVWFMQQFQWFRKWEEGLCPL